VGREVGAGFTYELGPEAPGRGKIIASHSFLSLWLIRLMGCSPPGLGSCSTPHPCKTIRDQGRGVTALAGGWQRGHCPWVLHGAAG